MIRPASESDIPNITSIWESAVSATHDFLSDGDFEFYKSRLPLYYLSVKLYVFEVEGTVKGFLGVSEDNIEMLFVDALAFGQGVGRALLDYAVQELGISKLEVNEQNGQARGFYEHYGFRVVGRSETDGEGKPYPLLSMEYIPAGDH